MAWIGHNRIFIIEGKNSYNVNENSGMIKFRNRIFNDTCRSLANKSVRAKTAPCLFAIPELMKFSVSLSIRIVQSSPPILYYSLFKVSPQNAANKKK